ncbi:MAG TPA: hypothetical protein VF263_16090 [Longimicrobiaceae bacterium]
MPHLVFALTVAAAATVFALLEIQVEGSAGWATALPTWRVENRWTRLLFGSRALTGYHLYVHLFVLLLIHLPYALGFVAPSLRAEARIAAFLVLFWVLEDFLWFVLNRDYGVRRFTPEHAWWHAPSWWWIMPREYWIFTPIGIALYAWSVR